MKIKPRINRYEGIKEGMDRIAQAIAENAYWLGEHSQSAGEAVHRMRLNCKRMRALLKLLAPASGRSVCMAADKQVRDVARKLSDLRDSNVVRQTIKQLSSEKKAKPLKPLVSMLEDESGESDDKPSDELRALLTQCTTTLSTVANQIAEIRPKATGWPLLATGLKTSYKAARDQYLKTKASEGVHAFHDLRKRCKDMLYQTDFVCALWSNNLKGLRKMLAKVSECLGKSNDLAVSAKKIAKSAGGKGAIAEAEKLLKKKRKKEAAKALEIAEKLFKPNHRDWITQMEATRWRPAPVAVKAVVIGPENGIPVVIPELTRRQPKPVAKARGKRSKLSLTA